MELQDHIPKLYLTTKILVTFDFTNLERMLSDFSYISYSSS